MASAGNIIAGQAAVVLTADITGLQNGINSAIQSVGQLGARMAAAGAGITAAGGAMLAPMMASVLTIGKVAGELGVISRRTGIATNALQPLIQNAKMSGVSVDQLQVALKASSKAMSDAADGSASANQALADVGLTIGELDNLSPEERFNKIGFAIASVEDPSKRAAAAMRLMGGSGVQALTMFDDPEAIAKANAELDRLGGPISASAIAAGAQLADAMDSFWASIERVQVAVGTALAPAMTQLIDYTTSLVGEISKWIDANPEVVQTYTVMAVAIAGIGIAITGIGTALMVVGPVFAAFAALFSPLGIAMAIIVGIIITWVDGWGAVGDALSGVIDWIRNFKIAGTTIGTIWDTAQIYAEGFFDFIGTALIDMGDQVYSVFEGIANTIGSMFAAATYDVVASSIEARRLLGMLTNDEAREMSDALDTQVAKARSKAPAQGYQARSDARMAAYGQRVAGRTAELGTFAARDAATEGSTLAGGAASASRWVMDMLARNGINIPKLPSVEDAQAAAAGLGIKSAAPSAPGATKPLEAIGAWAGRGVSGISASRSTTKPLEDIGKKQTEYLKKISDSIENVGVLE